VNSSSSVIYDYLYHLVFFCFYVCPFLAKSPITEPLGFVEQVFMGFHQSTKEQISQIISQCYILAGELLTIFVSLCACIESAFSKLWGHVCMVFCWLNLY